MEVPFLYEIVIIFLLSIVVTIVCNRLKLPATVGFLLTGVLCGPSLLGIVSNREAIDQVADIGVAMLLFTIGMELSGDALNRLKRPVFLGGSLQIGLTVLAVKPEDQDKLYGAIDLLAQATNTVARGEELKSAIEDNLLSLHEAIGDAEAPTVYMAGNSSVLQTAGPAMYQNYMIENVGGLNAAASVEDTYWAEVSYEQVLDWDPDYIILASDADYDVDSVLNDAALADCTAVKEGHVYQLPHAIEAVDSPVPGSFLGSVYLGSVLHPEQVSEQFYHDCADAFYTTYYGFTPASYE